MFLEPELWPIEVLHSENTHFDIFALVTLTLTRRPSYMNLTCIRWRYTGCANVNFLCQGFRNWSCGRKKQTDRMTSKLYTRPLCGWSKIHRSLTLTWVIAKNIVFCCSDTAWLCFYQPQTGKNQHYGCSEVKHCFALEMWCYCRVMTP